MQEYDWKWVPNSMRFEPHRFVHDPVHGKQVHQYASPYWKVEMILPLKAEKDRREIAAFMARTEGVAIVNIYDPRVPVPAVYRKYLDDQLLKRRIPDLTVKATSISNRTITVSGESGDKITQDDPIAFTHEGVRHYYRSIENLVLTGSDQELLVDLRPRKDLTGMSHVLTADERIRPTCRFQIRVNDFASLTNADGYTDFTIRGVEFFGAIT